MGRPFLAVVVAVVVIVVGMLIYPTVHVSWTTQSTAGWYDLLKAGGVILSYGFIFFMGYAVYRLVKK